MKTIIAGSRSITNYLVVRDAIADAIKQGLVINEVVSGKCPNGVDALGEQWARVRNISICAMPAHWNELGKVAGPERNARMARYADACIVVWDGVSRGTWNMVEEWNARHAHKNLYVYILKDGKLRQA